MKWLKRLGFLLGILALTTICMSGYFAFRRHSFEKQLARAKAYYESGDTAGAIAIAEDVYKRTRDRNSGREAVYLLGKYYVDLSELEKAGHYWDLLYGLDKEKYGDECLFNLASIARLNGRHNEAVKNYEQIINEYPGSNLVDDAILQMAIIYKEEGDLLNAQNRLMNLVEDYPQSNLMGTVEKELGDVNVGLLFSPQITEGTTEYVVEDGDSLFIIAKKFGTTVELIKRCNNLKSDFIKPKDKLKIITEKFSIIVDKSRNLLTLKIGERVVKTYPVGTGTGGSTPAGNYVINNKIVNPPWHKPGEGVVPFGDPRNVLGTRWIGLNIAGYGIHGTWEPDTIGKQVSAGCVRLLNEDVEELFQIVPVGAEVMIVE